MERKLKQVGDKIVVKHIIPDQELTPYEVLNTIKAIENNKNIIKNNIAKAEKDIEMIKQQIEANKNQEKTSNEDLKNLQTFEEWAKNLQTAKFKVIAKEISEECKKKVIDTYKKDDTMTEEQNTGQMYAQFKQYIVTNKKVTESINGNLVQDLIWNQKIIENPFKE